MRVVALEVENVKRLVAVEVKLDGTLQVIGGKNGAGKSSLMDAIWLAIGGGTATRETKTTKAVRTGADGAVARVDLGELVVTRTWKADGTSTVKVTTPDGAAFKSPQKILDELTASVGIDPFAFTQLSDADQVKTLLGLVSLPFNPASLDAERRVAFEERTDVNRRVREYAARLEGFPKPPPNLPADEVSMSELIAEYRGVEAEWASLRSARDEVDELEEKADQAAEDVETAERALEEAKARRVAALHEWEGAQHNVAAFHLNRMGDLADVQRRMDSMEATNAAVRREKDRQQGIGALAMAQGKADALTREIEAIDRRRHDALAAAEFPGGLPLGFADGMVTLNGEPFKQASAAEQIRTSVAMGMALKPKLRTLFIRDGSLLDDDTMALIAEMAAADDFQIIIERIGSNDPGAIVIVDGELA